MRYSVRLLTILFFGLAFNSLNGAALIWDATTIEEAVEPNTPKIEGCFFFHNPSGLPVTIVSLTPNCGCTVAELERKTYAAGESGQIKVVFTPGSRVGLQYKSVVVLDDTSAQPTTLKLNVNIQEFISLQPRQLEWSTKEFPQEKKIVCRSDQKNPFVVNRVDSSNPLFTTRVESISGYEFNVYIKPVSILPDETALVSINIKSSRGITRNIDVEAYIK